MSPLARAAQGLQWLGIAAWTVALVGVTASSTKLEMNHGTAAGAAYDTITPTTTASGPVQVVSQPATGTAAFFSTDSGTVVVKRAGKRLGETPLSIQELCTPGDELDLRFEQASRKPAVWKGTCEDGVMLLFTVNLEK